MNDLLTVKNVCYQVPDKTILKDITVSIKEKSYTTLTGPSGSGKSTLLKVMSSLISPTSGEIYFKQQNINDLKPEQYRMQVSYCFQQAALFGETVKDNFVFPYDIRKKSFQEEHVTHLLEEMLLPREYLTKKITELSGGEKQRVALIRNVIFPPEVLLLDEVTSGLDQESKQVVNNWLLQLNQEKHVTLIRVTHDVEEINQSKQIIHLVDGQLEESR